MTFSLKDLESLGYTLQPDGSYSHANNASMDSNPRLHPPRVHHPQPEPAFAKTLDRHSESQTGSEERFATRDCDPNGPQEPTNKKNSIEAQIGPQHKIVITRHAPRSLDLDNFAGGCKALIDAMKEEQLIPDDDPESVCIEFRQKKCKQPDQRTEIQIFIQAA